MSLDPQKRQKGRYHMVCRVWKRITHLGWYVRAIRGAITVEDNTEDAITEAVQELLDSIETANPTLAPTDLVSVIFSVTPDLDAIFPAKVARQRQGWNQVPLLDVQHMAARQGLPRCIRVLIQFNTPLLQKEIHHIYRREAQQLRQDLVVSPDLQQR